MSIVLIFDKDNINWSQDDPSKNNTFLRWTETYLQNVLRIKGTLFVKDVANALDIPLSGCAAYAWKDYGWRYYDGHRIRFDIWTSRNASQPGRPDPYYKIVLEPYDLLASSSLPGVRYISSSRPRMNWDNYYRYQRFFSDEDLFHSQFTSDKYEALISALKYCADKNEKGETVMPPVRTNFSIKKVIFSNSDRVRQPATVVLWSDGSKTVVKCCENDVFDPEKGLAMAIAKKALGNKGNYYETFKKWLPKEYRSPKNEADNNNSASDESEKPPVV